MLGTSGPSTPARTKATHLPTFETTFVNIWNDICQHLTLFALVACRIACTGQAFCASQTLPRLKSGSELPRLIWESMGKCEWLKGWRILKKRSSTSTSHVIVTLDQRPNLVKGALLSLFQVKMAEAFQLAIQIRELRRRSTVKFGKALVAKRLGYCSRNAICQVHFQNKMSEWHQMASNGIKWYQMASNGIKWHQMAIMAP